MIFIRTRKDNTVEFRHNMPFHEKHGLGKTEEVLLQEGFLVDSMPNVEQKEGKRAIMYYTEENGFWFEYVDKPLTQEEKVDKLREDMDYLILKQEGLI